MKKKTVTKIERETILLFNEEEDVVSIYTFNKCLKKRLATYAEKHPEICKLKRDDAEYGSMTYEIQKSRVSIRLIAPYSEERRKAASECAKKSGIHKKHL